MASADQPVNTLAAGFYENAIQTLRRVPKRLRATRNVDQRLKELYKLRENAGKESLSEMSRITSGPIDITQCVEAVRTYVKGKDLVGAIIALCSVQGGACRSKLKEFAERTLREYPLQAIFASTHLARDGRVVAKTPGFAFGSNESKEYQATLWTSMVKYYSLELDIIVKSMLVPALDVITVEHRVSETDLEYMVRDSPVVPTGRASLIAKGLFAGFERDFVSALHLLVPQVENLVRWHLKSAGVKTTTLSPDGIETENSMNSLVELSEFVTIFGEDFAFELKALFCDPVGPNLRNEVAHGLLDASDCLTPKSIYAWWLVLRITFR